MAKKDAELSSLQTAKGITSEKELWNKRDREDNKKKKGRRSSGGGGYAVPEVAPESAQPREDPYWEEMRGYYETRYAQALRESAAAAERASSLARREAERRSADLEEGYAALDRQLYRDYMEHRRTLPQELAAQGYTGGVSESARVRLHNSYEEAMAENRRAMSRQRSELDYQYALAEEQAQAQAEKSRAQALRDWQQGLMELSRERHSQTRADDLRRAQTLAEAGDFSGYRALGWSEGEIAYLSAMWLAKNPKLAGAASYGHYA